MKRYIGLCIFTLFTVAVSAQTTTVTATLTDSDSVVWANCTYTGLLISPNGVPTIAGVPVANTTFSGSCNSSGALSQVMATTALISPVGAYWSLVIQSKTSAAASSNIILQTVGGSQNATVNLSAQLTAPRFQPGAREYGYADGEVIGATGGAIYYNVALSQMRLFTSSWTSFAAAAGGVASINGTTGAFTFSGSAVSCTGTTCTFSGGGGGGLTSFTVATQPSVLYNLTLGGSPLTAPAMSFTPTTTSQGFVLAGPVSGSGAWAFRALVPSDVPTLNQSTTGQANTALALASAPTLCGTGNAPTGILTNGNATGCAPIGGGSAPAGTGWVHVTGGVYDTPTAIALNVSANFSSVLGVGQGGLNNTGPTGLDQSPVSTSVSVSAWKAIGNCATALTYSTTTHLYGCNASLGTGTVTNAAPLTTNGFVIGAGSNAVQVDGGGAGTDNAGNVTGVSFHTTASGGIGGGFIGSNAAAPTCTSGQSGIWADSTANAVKPCNNGVVASFMFTSTALLSSQLPSQYKIFNCQPGLDGASSITAIGAGTYTQVSCYNATGVTITLTSIRCFTNNNGTSTLAVTNGAGTALLTGAVTCTNAFAAGTQSGTTTVAAGDFIKFTFVADATVVNAAFVIAGTY